jgi:hypothetical protein
MIIRSTVFFSLALGLASVVSAGVIQEGFEGSGYDLTAGKASVSTAAPHSGAQSVVLSINSASDYARVKLDVSSYGLTLGQITSADYWVNRTSANEQAPYIIFSIATPNHTTDEVMAVMYNNPGVSQGQWTDIQIGASSMFHVEGDGTGLSNPSGITFGALQSSIYSPGITWGSLPVDYVRIGMGAAGNDGIAVTSYVDDLSINAASSAVPEPASLTMLAAGLLGLGMMLRRKIATR